MALNASGRDRLFERPIERVTSWFASMELLSAGFITWAKFGLASMAWLWEQREADGLWDFGPRAARSNVLPFSDLWRVPRNRKVDWSARLLCLFARCHWTQVQ